MYTNINFLESLLVNLNSISINDINKINNFPNFIKNNEEIQKWNEHQKAVSKIKKFKAKGIIIYTNGIKKIFLRFCWDNLNSDHFKFKAYTFFGIKLIEFIYNKGKADLKNYGKVVYSESNSQNLFEKTFGINIPIKNLSLWLVGLPGNSNEFNLNSIGMLKEIKNTKDSKYYNIIYHKYYYENNTSLPINIEFNQGDNNINLKINNWILH